MKIAYFDCFAGISGDMTLGALFDAGLDFELWKCELDKLQFAHIGVSTEKILKNGISATQIRLDLPHEHAHRGIRDIEAILRSSQLSKRIQDRAMQVFDLLAQAEAAVHNTTVESIHFHEVGAMDSIVDIVGVVIGLELLGIESVSVSAIHLGSGFVKCAHGLLPVPAPATAKLLIGVPCYSRDGIDGELTTPTGAAILKAFATSFGAMPPMQPISIGYGAGNRDLKELPNTLRIVIGESAASGYQTETISVLETNIDHLNPEDYEYLMERLFQSGALDVTLMPMIMKKSRPAVKATVLCMPGDRERMIAILFEETGTLGIRIQEMARVKLERSMREIDTPWGKVRIKTAFRDGKVYREAPEYEDCARIARETGLPIRTVREEISRSCVSSSDTPST